MKYLTIDDDNFTHQWNEFKIEWIAEVNEGIKDVFKFKNDKFMQYDAEKDEWVEVESGEED